MQKLIISFAISLENYSTDQFFRPHGPLFHRWLPNGENDTLAIDTGHQNIELKLWFARKGHIRNGFIEYDDERHEVDENIVKRQAVLDAGPLFGKLIFSNIEDADAEVLQHNRINDARYIQLGKNVYNLLFPVLTRFITILRTNYGQYWIRELEPWDSRTYPLGYYCSTFLNMHWSLDNEQTWNSFKPSDGPIKITVPKSSEDDFQQYLLPEDYNCIGNLLNQGFSPSFAATALGSAHQLLDQGNLRFALIQAVIALELALQEFHSSKFKADQELFKKMKSFWDLPLRAQMLATVSSLPEFDIEAVKSANKAIDMRNNVVHDGWMPPHNRDTFKTIRDFLKLISLLIGGPKFKFPKDARGRNKLYPSS
jgi:hypothetical protein